jgi:hypothetical protein
MQQKPERMQVSPEKIPSELKALNQWVVWNWTWNEEKKKWDKPPMQPNGINASSTKSATWVSFSRAWAAYESGKWDGIGFALTEKDPFLAFDFDDVRNGHGEVAPWAVEMIQRLASYTEVSPSGRGFKTIVKGKLPAGGHHGEVLGAFDCGRYLCITGNMVEDFWGIESRQDVINQIVREKWPGDFQKGGQEKTGVGQTAQDLKLIESKAVSDPGLAKLWAGDFSGFPSQSEADLALASKLVKILGPDPQRINEAFRKSGLHRSKWESRRGDSTYGIQTIQKAMEPQGMEEPPPPQEPPPQSARTSFNTCVDKDNKSALSKGVVTSDQKTGCSTSILEPTPEMYRDFLKHSAVHKIRSGMSATKSLQELEMIGKTIIPELSRKEIEEIFEAARASSKTGESIAQKVAEIVSQMPPESNITVTEMYVHCNIPVTGSNESNNAKTTVRVALGRLEEQGVIAHLGGKAGYRKIDRESSRIDFLNADVTPVPLRLPFEIERLVKILPRNQIVIAGEQNAGKTAFLLNFAYMNREKFKVNYFSSEMGNQELRLRMEEFKYPLVEWTAINFQDRVTNFHDVIQPDEINVIDYLEITDKFYLVADLMLRIHEKLKTGVCFIALQKDPNKETGRGGTFGLEKPRLYLNITKAGSLEIVKAKIWADKRRNPNDLCRLFKLVDGQQFIPTTDWMRKEPKK